MTPQEQVTEFITGLDALISETKRLTLLVWWDKRGWQWRDDKEPSGFYKAKGNGYMNEATALAEMRRVERGEDVPF